MNELRIERGNQPGWIHAYGRRAWFGIYRVHGKPPLGAWVRDSERGPVYDVLRLMRVLLTAVNP